MVIDRQGGAAVAVAPDGSGVISQAGSLHGTLRDGPDSEVSTVVGRTGVRARRHLSLAVRGGEGCGEAPDVPWDDQAADFAFSPDGSILGMRGSGTSLATWRAATGDLLNVTADLTTAGPAFDPDGSRIAASRGGADVAVLDPSTLHATSTVLELDGIERLQFSPDGSRPVAVSAAFDTRSTTPARGSSGANCRSRVTTSTSIHRADARHRRHRRIDLPVGRAGGGSSGRRSRSTGPASGSASTVWHSLTTSATS